MTEELRLWSVGQSGDVKLLDQLSQMPTELEFEELLVQNPDMLGTRIELREWPHGGHFCAFQSEQDWSDHKAAVLEFVASVMTNRSNAVVEGLQG